MVHRAINNNKNASFIISRYKSTTGYTIEYTSKEMHGQNAFFLHITPFATPGGFSESRGRIWNIRSFKGKIAVILCVLFNLGIKLGMGNDSGKASTISFPLMA